MRKLLWIIALAASMASTSFADTVYNVNVNIGGDILAGTISTDGKIGQLAVGDVTAYSLSDSLNLLGTTLTMSNSTFMPGETNRSILMDIQATPTQLSVQGPFSSFNIVSPTVTVTFLPPTGGDSQICKTGLPCVGGATAVLTGVPEINSTSGSSALALVAGAVLIIRGRRKVPAHIA